MPDSARELLEQLYSDGSYDEEFPTDPKRHTRIDTALASLSELLIAKVEGMKKQPYLSSYTSHTKEDIQNYYGEGGHNQALTEVQNAIRRMMT